ncbi:MAG TPA: flagellar motor protein MotB [Bryobacteraceae bacterium]|nr:flagellar motor protein MotB [Bryobacteraceae bacterium]
MARKKAAPEHENHERWLVSYADFITLLFAFFVVMFATSQTDKSKAKAVEDSVKKALAEGEFSSIVVTMFGGSPRDKGKGNAQMQGPGGGEKIPEKSDARLAELLPSLKVLSKELEAEIKNGKIQITMEPRGLVVSFRQAALFPSGTATVLPDARGPVAKIARAISEIPNPVRLEGHTDSVPIHNEQYQSNWELSAARSIALMRLLTEDGVAVDKLSIAGYADNAPAESNATEEGRSRNRRVDVVVLNETGLRAEPRRATPQETEKQKPSITGPAGRVNAPAR